MNQPAAAKPQQPNDEQVFDALSAICLRQVESMRMLDDLVRRLPAGCREQQVLMNVVQQFAESHAVLNASAMLASLGARISPERLASQLLGVITATQRPAAST